MSGWKKILIIDDDAEEASSLVALLKAGGGLQVVVAEDAGKAPAVNGARQAGLVLFSLSESKIAKQLAEVREIRQWLQGPVIFLVDEAAKAELELKGEAAPSNYVMKPVVERELRAVIDAAVRLHKCEARLQRLESNVLDVQCLESIGVVAGGVAHEFNNLITGIYGAVAMAHKELPAASPVHERLNHIERAANRAADLCQRLMVPPGNGANTRRPLSLNEVVEDALKILQPDFRMGLELQTGFGHELPKISGVEAYLRQVVINLVRNSVEAMGDGSGVIRVVTYLMQLDASGLLALRFTEDLTPGEYVVLEVADTGCGMDEATSSKMFDPLFSTKNANRGLGLAAVARLVRKHRGGINAESSRGHGTLIRIFLPAIQAEQAEVPFADETTPPMAGRTSPILPVANGSGNVIMVVDDDDAVRALAKWVAERAGYVVTTARDGDEALRIFSADPNLYRLLMLDLSMPRMGGLEAMQKIRAIKPGQRVAIVTGHGEHMLSGDVEGGDVAFLQKPFSPERLRGFLHKNAPLSSAGA